MPSATDTLSARPGYPARCHREVLPDLRWRSAMLALRERASTYMAFMFSVHSRLGRAVESLSELLAVRERPND